MKLQPALRAPLLVLVGVSVTGVAAEWLVPGMGPIIAVAVSAAVLLWWAKRRSACVEQQLRHVVAACEDATAMPLLATLLPTDIPHSQWSLCPAALVRVLNEVALREHRTVVECGSGVSTLLIAAKLRQLGRGHVWSIEHDVEWARYMTRLIERCALQDWVTLVRAPLEKTRIASRDLQWYERGALTDVLALPAIDVLLVDGPPSHTGAENRVGALPVFGDQLHAGSLALLDDAYRPGERSVLEAWQAMGPYTTRLWQTSRGQFEIRKRA